MQDWVLYTQNLICKHYAEKVLVHSDPDIMPLYSDRRRQANSVTIINDLKSIKYHYTGYVCDESMPLHKRKNNIIYVSTGLNKEEGIIIIQISITSCKRF